MDLAARPEQLKLIDLAVRREGRQGMPRTEEFIDYKTSMITDEEPLRGLLFY